MKILTVHHSTTYRYARPVAFGQHRLMLRPRDSHDLHLVAAELSLSHPGTLRSLHDVFGNSVTLLDFEQPAAELSIVSTLRIERYGLARPEFPLDPAAELYPFVYLAGDRTDLGRLVERHYPDPHNVVDEWARQFTPFRPVGTLNLLSNMNKAIRETFALLFIEAARSLGFGARFVTGYLYDPALDGGDAVQGAGATHAWADVYLPGAGWVEYDPTNGVIAGENLIRVAVTRDASQAVPVAGSFDGEASDYLGMQVEVVVTAEKR